MQETVLCALLWPINTTAAELFKPLNDHISGTLNWSFCVCICSDGVAAMTEWLLGFTTRVKEVASECGSPHCEKILEKQPHWQHISVTQNGSRNLLTSVTYSTCSTQSITSGKNDNCAQAGR